MAFCNDTDLRVSPGVVGDGLDLPDFRAANLKTVIAEMDMFEPYANPIFFVESKAFIIVERYLVKTKCFAFASRPDFRVLASTGDK
jgi:hypothetical protein